MCHAKRGKKRVFVREKFGANLEECLVGRNDDSSCERFQTWEGCCNVVVVLFIAQRIVTTVVAVFKFVHYIFCMRISNNSGEIFISKIL